jgi:hypothetical protein
MDDEQVTAEDRHQEERVSKLRELSQRDPYVQAHLHECFYSIDKRRYYIPTWLSCYGWVKRLELLVLELAKRNEELLGLLIEKNGAEPTVVYYELKPRKGK